MYIEYLKTDCIAAINTKKFISAVEVELLNGKGKVVKKNRVNNVLKVCEKIGCQQDDLLITYDIYFKQCCGERMIRVLTEM